VEPILVVNPVPTTVPLPVANPLPPPVANPLPLPVPVPSVEEVKAETASEHSPVANTVPLVADPVPSADTDMFTIVLRLPLSESLRVQRIMRVLCTTGHMLHIHQWFVCVVHAKQRCTPAHLMQDLECMHCAPVEVVAGFRFPFVSSWQI
jgi:hypothetical protein